MTFAATRIGAVSVKVVSTTKCAVPLLCQVDVAYRSEKYFDWLLSQTQQPILMLSDSLELRKHCNQLLSGSWELRKYRDLAKKHHD